MSTEMMSDNPPSTEMVSNNPPSTEMVSDNPPSIEEMTQTIRLDPAEVKEHFDRIGHFRILVVGRSNAGKTTLLQRVCNTTELPDIYNSKGEKVQYLIVQRHRLLMP